MNNKRIVWVDNAKYFCIMFVMLSHLESGSKALDAFYPPFYLMGFFFTSGYVYKHKKGFSEFFLHKVQGLFVPWLVFSVFNILLSQVISFNEHHSLWTELIWNFLQIRGEGDGLWFVAALFVMFIPFYFVIEWYETMRNRNSITAAGWTLVISAGLYVCSVIYEEAANPQWFPWNSTALPWHLEYIFQGMFFMVLGYLFKGTPEAVFDRYAGRGSVWLYLIVYMLLCAIPGDTNTVCGIACSHMFKLVGVFVLITVCKKIAFNRYVAFVGANTLVYFALHGKVYSLGQTLLRRFAGNIYSTILNNDGYSSLFAIVFTIFISVVLIGPAYLINRYCPWLLGRKRLRP